MTEIIAACTIGARLDKTKDNVFAWLSVVDQNPHNTSSRGYIWFANPDEVQAAIRELRALLPAVDQLGEVADV